MNWRPGASLPNLREAAQLRRSIHDWMALQGVLEVLTPALSQAAATDPHVLSIRTAEGRYLHTSPEFPMKRLLAAHAVDAAAVDAAAADAAAVETAAVETAAVETAAGKNQEIQPDLYQIATVFRAEESGRFHNTEFTLLEWYRLGMDHVELMADLDTLLQHVWQAFDKPWPGMQTRRYGMEVHQLLGVWPEEVDTDTIAAYFAAANRSYPAAIATDTDAALDLFMDEFVLPGFAEDAFTLLIDYPVSQSALARLGKDDNGRDVARRFELYFGQVELANGFHELSDAQTQRTRFEADLVKREGLGVATVPLDEYFLDALVAGLPDCAGIALGLERLQMVLGQHAHINEVLSFDDQRA